MNNYFEEKTGWTLNNAKIKQILFTGLYAHNDIIKIQKMHKIMRSHNFAGSWMELVKIKNLNLKKDINNLF